MRVSSPDFPGVAVLNGSEDLLGFLPEVGGELEAVDVAGGVTHHQDRLLGVEGDLVEAPLTRGDHLLPADLLVLVEVNVEHSDAPVPSDQGEDGAGVGRPGHVIHLVTDIVTEDRV